MSWKDFFYFSKGERRALTLLLFIISVSFVLLLIKDQYLPVPIAEQPIKVTTTITQDSATTKVIQPQVVSKSEKPNNAKVSKTKYTPKPRFTKSAPSFNEKYPKGTIVELNHADTTSLKKIPGIGTAFSNRIIKYRELLGGYYSISQLQEVYGIDEEKYTALAVWFETDTSAIRKLKINQLPIQSLARHPYLNYKQAQIIINLRERKGNITSWQMLELLDEFTESDKNRLRPYISFD